MGGVYEHEHLLNSSTLSNDTRYLIPNRLLFTILMGIVMLYVSWRVPETHRLNLCPVHVCDSKTRWRIQNVGIASQQL
jgi:hypothetical protein